jgi:hypothetical protein
VQALLESLTGTLIKFEQTGDVGVTGRLVNVQQDYASVLTGNHQIIHYPFSQLKSIGTNITEMSYVVPVPDVEFPPTFHELLQSLLFQLVQIEVGEGSRQGVLSSFQDDQICVVVKTQELVFYPVNQIRNIAPIYYIRTEDTAADSSSDASSDKNQSDSEGNEDSTGTSQDQNSASGNKNSGSSSDSNHSTSNESSKGSGDSENRNRTVSSSSHSSYVSHGACVNTKLARRMADKLLAEESGRSGGKQGKTHRFQSKKFSESSPSYVNKRCRVKYS